MSNNEIIKAMECLKGYALHCKNCPYSPRYKFPLCQQKVAKDALSLITRQKAEIERLKRECDKAWEEHSEAELKYDLLFDEAEALIRRAKSEARREFAEKIHKHCTSVELNEYIDTLIEEMESESE